MRVLEAALDEISRGSFENLSIEKIAALAGVNRTTIYRRWPTPQLLAAAALARASDNAPLPNTGCLRSDMLEFLLRFRLVCRAPAMLSLIRLGLSDDLSPELKTLVNNQLEKRDSAALMIFERAVRRNELSADADIVLMRDLMIGGAQYLIVFPADNGSSEKLETFVDLILCGVRGHNAMILPAYSPDQSELAPHHG